MMPRRGLLLIEDTASLRLVYAAAIRSAGHDLTLAATSAEGMAAFLQDPPAAVLLDLMLPDGDGLELLRKMRAIRPRVPIIVITANGSIDKAVKAMRAGAHDFLVKPLDERRLLEAARGAMAAGARETVQGYGDETAPEGFIGQSMAMQQVYGQVRAAARSMASVLITGESGTGKELCARVIHGLSDRATGPFVPVSCGAIPGHILATQVFGYGTGGATGRLGAAADADGGTLFLDDICEMEPALQVRLLHFLQSMTIRPSGSPEPRDINLRIISASGSDPLDAIRQGRLRADLYYRLHVLAIHMPPLRDRGSDVIAIAQQALVEHACREGRNFTAISDDAARLLQGHAWPGNVRQLLNTIWHCVVMNDGPVLTPSMLPDDIRTMKDARIAPAPAGGGEPINSLIGRSLADIERLIIERTIETQEGSIARAARILEVAPSTLYRKLEGWSDRPRPR